MKLFELEKEFSSNWEWSALLLTKENSRLSLIEKFKNNEFLDISDPIYLLLVNNQSVKSDRKETPFKTDMIYFGDDITYGAFSPSMSCYMILSKKLKRILNNFELPPHQYYPVLLKNNEDGKINDEYELLQILLEVHDKTNYDLTLYEYADFSTDEILKSKRGGFKNRKDYFARMEESINQNNIHIKIKERITNVRYDVMWGLPNILNITEELKNAIEAANLLGVKCTPFKRIYLSEAEYWARENDKKV